jgi:tagatose 1,6-diphosphate aldolase GatY/KbaY
LTTGRTFRENKWFSVGILHPEEQFSDKDNMQFLPLLDLLKPAREAGYAVPSFCVWNAETMLTVLSVAADMQAPVILMSGPVEFYLLSPGDMADIARTVAGRFSAPAALHYDHGDSLEQAEECLAAGYTSVMLDYSAKPYSENVAGLRHVVKLAHPRGVTVEGEIGHVGQADVTAVEGMGASTLTEVGDAVSYVADTQVDALAVSIGNAHGQYTRLPRLDFERLSAIRAAVDVPLVLHGGSGTPEEDLRRAIALGMAKVNVATELVLAYRQTLLAQWGNKKNLWAPIALADAMKAVAPVVEKWIRATGAEGQSRGF